MILGFVDTKAIKTITKEKNDDVKLSRRSINCWHQKCQNKKRGKNMFAYVTREKLSSSGTYQGRDESARSVQGIVLAHFVGNCARNLLHI